MTYFNNKLSSLGQLSIGVFASTLALACGNVEKSPGDEAAAPVAPIEVPVERETCTENSLLAECQEAPVTPPPPVEEGDAAALAKAAAENILASNCGQCHGPNLDEEDALAGMNYINDIDQLVDTGKIVPLDSARSLIVQRMVRGEMPPPNSNLPAVTLNDIDVVSSYIDNPVFWPDFRPATARDCSEDGQVVSFDELFRDIQDDLFGFDDDDAVFLRYISLTNRFTAGICADALDRDRQGLVKMLNMLSIRGNIQQPVAVNAEETLYRIDMRDFDWDRDIDVGGQNFPDAWEAIVDANPYAVPFEGDDVDDLVDEMGTEIPLMFADHMLSVAMIGNLYYGIIGVDGNGQLEDFVLNDLGIDVDENLDQEEAIRAGTTRSRVSRQDRLIERHDMGLRSGVYWQSFDFGEDDNSSDIFSDPFGFEPGGTEAIFTLPNGMLAYIIADENGNIVEDSDILLDTNLNNFRAVTAVSCSNCHATGLIPVVDEVGEFARDNSRQLRLNRDDIELLESIYVEPEVFAEQVQEDTETFYQRALQDAQLPLTGGDPVSNVFLRFDEDVELNDVAGDLGVTPDELRDTLNLLEPEFAVLERGQLDRDDFEELYVQALCIMAGVGDNVPDQNLCDN